MCSTPRESVIAGGRVSVSTSRPPINIRAESGSYETHHARISKLGKAADEFRRIGVSDKTRNDAGVQNVSGQLGARAVIDNLIDHERFADHSPACGPIQIRRSNLVPGIGNPNAHGGLVVIGCLTDG
jgi:hypothetical protein